MKIRLPVTFSTFATLLAAVTVNATRDPRITPAPELPPHLGLRQLDAGPNVYGYIDGDINSPIACGAGYQFQREDDIAGCCNKATCTSVYAMCINRGGENPCSGALEALCGTGGQVPVLSCQSSAPFCYQYMVMSDAQDLNPAYFPRCGTTTNNVQVFVTPTNGAEATPTADVKAESKTLTAVNPSMPRTITSDSTARETGSNGSGDDNNDGPSSSSPPSNPAPTKISTKTIIIIVVAISAAFVIVGIVATALYLRKKKKERDDPDLPSNISVVPSNFATNEARMEQIERWQNTERGAFLSPSAPPLPPRNLDENRQLRWRE